MPLPKRVIEPVFVARSVYDRQELPNDLETVTNTTLTNIVRQLSSLSKHSEDLFGELARETNNLAERANSLQARIDKLSIKVTSLDSNVEEVSLQDIHLKKAFKSTTVFDQQIFSRATMPTAMLETYKTCDKPPPLDKLNCYRDDGRDGLKFYTDPNYFFELWRQEMIKDTERMMHDRKKFHKPKTESHSGAKRHNKRPRQPTNTREKQKQIAIGHGETIMPTNVTYVTPNALLQNEDPGYGVSIYDPNRPNRPNSIELRRSYPADAIDSYQPMSPHYQQQNQQQNHYMQQQQQMYDESIYNQYQQQMGQQNMSMESPYAPGTPSKGKPRPSEPPPAPPSTGSASNPNTPTRGRSISTGRDILPPPPPIPDAQSPQHQHQMQNGGMTGQQKLYGRVPGQMIAGQHVTDNAGMAMMQQQINNMNAINMQINQMNINDLPPPPPIPQTSPKSTSPPNSAPPPPPPPPPLEGPVSPPPKMPNGDINANGIITQPSQLPKLKTPPKKVITPYQDDCRSELMKSIRDGVMLKKVERQKNDTKDSERSTALHDVASILARRVAIELTDSECSESDEDEDGWGETNETSA